MIAKLFDIRPSAIGNVGLFAKELIPRGTIICFECKKCKLYSKEDLRKLKVEEQEELDVHGYRKDDNTWLLPCDETKFLNHSCNANILQTQFGFDVVARDILPSEEATYDYRVFYEDNCDGMVCNCKSTNCCKVLKSIWPIPTELRSAWNTATSSALKLANEVKQPLITYIKNGELGQEALLLFK